MPIVNPNTPASKCEKTTNIHAHIFMLLRTLRLTTNYLLQTSLGIVGAYSHV
ncbi:MAG: hypothetical protein ACI9DH_000836 [Halioglobus sp.]|jgi:hypothetical protein